MSTTAPVPNVQTQTPEEIAQQIADHTVQQPATVSEPAQLQREYVIETKTGQVFRGKTQQELIDQLKNSVENATPLIAEYNRMRKSGEQQVAPPPQPQAFDPNKFYEMWATDPAAADEYKMKAIYGVSMQEAIEIMREVSDFTRRVEPQTVMAQWQSESDFPTSDPAEMQKAGLAIQELWPKMFPNGAKVTPENLEMVHSTALHRGMYRSEKELSAQQQPQQFTQMATPTLQGGSSTMQQPTFNAATAKPEQIKQFLESLNGQR